MHIRFHQTATFVAAFAFSAMASASALGQDNYDLYGGQSFYDSSAGVPSQELFEGWWLGGTIGGETVSYDLSPGEVSSNGLIGGVIGGYSWQHGPFVLGLEGDFLASDSSGSKRINNGRNKVRVAFDNLADIRLRAGFTVLPNVLLFGSVGGAWANGDVFVAGPGGAFREETFFGWSAGAGAEFAYDKNLSLRVDYQFTDFDSKTVSYPGGKQTFDPDSNAFRGSVIYRF